MGKDKDREKHRIKSQGIHISHIEKSHVALKYPAVVTTPNLLKSKNCHWNFERVS